ncbi:hypothetical protein DAPPUDRAFT_333325 [Daphnia pulex]|uniref:Uncharacterized protein n=1 Tax=Daphnia pulex TaxID=6669 RepID=E9HSJ4_DAPPU|nr:hypothetical protein DAPPUDRAFT_333325 [Daphnia pulex]|eukprot:EFX65271.1 hypothetical protein DAPPUDRAFT_333325 [Daphnia pulex]
MLEKEPSIRITSSIVVNQLTNILRNSSIRIQQMFTLIAKGNQSVEDIGKLIQEGVDLNVKDPYGLTPLLRLANSKKISDNFIEIVSLLIKNGANVNSLDSNDKNALLLWCKNRKQHTNQSFLAILNLFVENGIDINCKNEYGDNALTFFAEVIKVKTLSTLFDFSLKMESISILKTESEIMLS